MIERIPQTMLANTTIYNIHSNMNRMTTTLEQMSSGKRIKFASDDPASSVDSMRLRKELAAREQYDRNISDANSWLQTTDSAMNDISSRYSLAKDSLIRANSGSMGPASLKAIAADLREQAGALNKLVNTTYMGRTVFAGNSDKGTVYKLREIDGKQLFVPTDTKEVSAKPVVRRLNGSQEVSVNTDGYALFGTDDAKFDGNHHVNNPDHANIMNLLLRTADELERENPALSPAQRDEMLRSVQGVLDNRMQGLQTAMSTNGAKHKSVLENADKITADIHETQGQISAVEDVDIQKLTIDLSLAQMAYQASLGATQRVVQPTLLDYLR